jgi:cytochrome P450
MEDPRDVLQAPSHPDPYPWYARLRRERPLFFDDALGLWVVSAAALVREALREPLLRVRPPVEPVPRALADSFTGEVFAQLVRMNDGDFHARHRPAVEASAARWSAQEVEAAAERATEDLAPRLGADALLAALPAQAMARLLGVAPDALDATVAAVQAFVGALGAGADADAIRRSDAAVRWLMAQGEAQGLAGVAAANRIALMQQALDATAGLIGNAIAAWQRAPGPLAGTAFVEAVATRDPAVHNTRRFAAADLPLAGERIATGQGLVLVLAGEGDALGFGTGPHACPGERIALQLAAAALRSLQRSGALARNFGPVRGYRPLPNARIPVFGA